MTSSHPTGDMSMPPAPIAAIVHDAPGGADAVLADFALRLRQAGWRVRGLVQLPRDNRLEGKRMTLVDLDDDGRHFRISQDLGSGARGCCLDPAGVSAASGVLRQVLAEGADLAVANRFGTLEASGQGLADEMLSLMAAGIPLLTVVNDRYLQEWRAFTGHAGVELEPRSEALQAWFDGLGLQRSAA
ncbi:DUF2478 domain-containing protein [Flavobacterium sp. MXW15]|uniref:DUF2478 domain-containing protein n=1 Tax=Xanthomonas chitinilytica TaxID=2989819 RepID=A0ABT3JVL6_9XANT|nr:DUF2478 domain-containing protein [Xanthomonas sp. H13-6]MCW4454862.1 DUF2478 domain-containing protein [Flavobacterium sp. MXW15]MCW4472510.1 DUF2478 domain-containing protein [Xanthomonas sp. H13-6]